MKKAVTQKYKSIAVSTPPEIHEVLKQLKKRKIINKISWFIIDAIREKIKRENLISLSIDYDKKTNEIFYNLNGDK